MQDFRKLRVWHKAQELSVEIYKYTAGFRKDETYGLRGQLRRASVSVGSNTAEASKRVAKKDKARLLNFAESSAAEAISELDLAQRLGYGPREVPRRLANQYDALLGMLENLRRRVLAGKDLPECASP
jgi:four helix bundle protein